MALSLNKTSIIAGAICILGIAVSYFLFTSFRNVEAIESGQAATTRSSTPSEDIRGNTFAKNTEPNHPQLKKINPEKKLSSFDKIRKTDTENNILTSAIDNEPNIGVENNSDEISKSLYEEIVNRIDQMSREEIIFQTASLTDFSEKELNSFNDPHTFAKKMAELADVSKEDEPNDYLSVYGSIVFSAKDYWQMGESVESTLNFPTFTTKVFAVLPEIDNIDGAVFVRWYKSGSNRPLLFNKYTTDKEASRNHIWIESMQGWEPGTYKVDVYSNNEYLDYLASGSYTVSNNF